MIHQAMYETNSNIFYELSVFPKQTKTGIYKINIIAKFGKIKHPISIDFQGLWCKMCKKYEFMDKTIDFKETVEFTKNLLSK